jgi:hypothetical protein
MNIKDYRIDAVSVLNKNAAELKRLLGRDFFAAELYVKR